MLTEMEAQTDDLYFFNTWLVVAWEGRLHNCYILLAVWLEFSFDTSLLLLPMLPFGCFSSLSFSLCHSLFLVCSPQTVLFFNVTVISDCFLELIFAMHGFNTHLSYTYSLLFLSQSSKNVLVACQVMHHCYPHLSCALHPLVPNAVDPGN